MGQEGTDATETGAEGSTENEGENTAETVESLEAKLAKYKEIAAEQEKRAKANADAAKRLAEIEDAQKTEAQKAADRIAELEKQISESSTAALRFKVASEFKISADDAELFLTGSDEESLRKQAERLAERDQERKKQGNHVRKEGTSTQKGSDDDEGREFAKELFARAQAAE